MAAQGSALLELSPVAGKLCTPVVYTSRLPLLSGSIPNLELHRCRVLQNNSLRQKGCAHGNLHAKRAVSSPVGHPRNLGSRQEAVSPAGRTFDDGSNCPRTKRSTKQLLPTAESPRRTSFIRSGLAVHKPGPIAGRLGLGGGAPHISPELTSSATANYCITAQCHSPRPPDSQGSAGHMRLPGQSATPTGAAAW
eukprot:scaffold3581_cov417-Prasinococcus_capsulatus_cf.AAC.7